MNNTDTCYSYAEMIFQRLKEKMNATKLFVPNVREGGAPESIVLGGVHSTRIFPVVIFLM